MTARHMWLHLQSNNMVPDSVPGGARGDEEGGLQSKVACQRPQGYYAATWKRATPDEALEARADCIVETDLLAWRVPGVRPLWTNRGDLPHPSVDVALARLQEKPSCARSLAVNRLRACVLDPFKTHFHYRGRPKNVVLC